VQRAGAAGEVEGCALELEPGRIALDEGDIRERARTGTRLGQQLRLAVDCHDLADVRREREGERTGSRTRVESTLVPHRVDETADVLGQVGAPALLELGDLRGRPTPAIA